MTVRITDQGQRNVVEDAGFEIVITAPGGMPKKPLPEFVEPPAAAAPAPEPPPAPPAPEPEPPAAA